MTTINARSRWLTLPFFLFFSFCPLFFRSTGEIYSAILLFSAALLYLQRKSPLLLLGFFIILFFFLLFLACYGFKIDVWGNTYAWLPGDPNVVKFGKFRFEVILAPVSEVIYNNFHSLVINSSFSLAFLCLIFSLLSTLNPTQTFKYSYNLQAFLALSAGVTILTFSLAQLFFDFYLQGYAQPSHDTGNSRFLQSFAFISLILFALIFGTLAPSRPRSDG